MVNQEKITISLPNNIREELLKVATKNKIENLNKGLKGENKKPDSITKLIWYACEKVFLKN